MPKDMSMYNQFWTSHFVLTQLKNTPWPPCNVDTDESEARGWTDGWSHVRNNNPTYTRLDEMNDYKNRLHEEIERLTNGLLQTPSLSSEE